MISLALVVGFLAIATVVYLVKAGLGMEESHHDAQPFLSVVTFVCVAVALIVASVALKDALDERDSHAEKAP